MSSLSKSALWIKMQDYYHNIGPEAWQNELVPLQISSNKNLALAYANVIIGNMLDWYQANPLKANEEPFYVLEIGAGHGKFSFYVLKYLHILMGNFDLPLNSIKFVMTDIATKNIDALKQHPTLQPLFKSGSLDIAVFNAMSDTEINLIISGTTIKQNSLQKPVFVVCNYLFDSLSHDAFQVRDKKLYEVQIKIDSEADWEEYFAKAKFSFKYEPISSDYYKDPALNVILKKYEQELDDATFMIPVGGIDCINTIQQFTKHPLVLLLADKGQASVELFDDAGEPDISIHGSISLMVNFDALRQYFALKQGTALLMPNTASEFQVACFMTQHSYEIPHTKHAFVQSFYGASPQDIINMCYIDDEVNDDFKNIDHLLALLNLTLWDPNIFYDMHEKLIDLIEDAELTVEQDQILQYGTKLVWEFFFKLEKTQDLPFAIGSLYYAIDEYELALQFFKISLQEFGENAENLYNMAITYQALENLPDAKKFAQRTLVIDAAYSPAKELLAEVS